MRVLITGASGFIGRATSQQALARGWQVRGTLLPSEPRHALVPSVEPAVMQLPAAGSDLIHAVEGMDAVIHLAARVHILREASPNPLHEFRRTNTEGTVLLALQAAESGVTRFVFMSTIGVNGKATADRAFSENDDPAPHNPYSASKFEAELALLEIGAKTGMEVVIVRAPLVYGPGNPGNFLSLQRIIATGLPLPFSSIRNARSFLYVENLADALACCSTHPAAAGKTYLVSDGEDLSTPDLIRHLAAGSRKPARLFPIPTGLLRYAGKICGKSSALEQLIGSLRVDSSKIRRELGWRPPVSMMQGLRTTAEWFQSTQSKRI